MVLSDHVLQEIQHVACGDSHSALLAADGMWDEICIVDVHSNLATAQQSQLTVTSHWQVGCSPSGQTSLGSLALDTVSSYAALKYYRDAVTLLIRPFYFS